MWIDDSNIKLLNAVFDPEELIPKKSEEKF